MKYILASLIFISPLALSSAFAVTYIEEMEKCKNEPIFLISAEGELSEIFPFSPVEEIRDRLIQKKFVKLKSNCMRMKSQEELSINYLSSFKPNVSEEVGRIIEASLVPESPGNYREMGLYVFELHDGRLLFQSGTSNLLASVNQIDILLEFIENHRSLNRKSVKSIHFFHTHPALEGSGWTDLMLSGQDTGLGGVPYEEMELICGYLGSSRPPYFIHAVPYRFKNIGVFTSFKYVYRCPKI